MDPSEESIGGGFVANDDASKVVEPTMGTFNFEAVFVASQCTAVLCGFLLSAFAMRTDKFNLPLPHEAFSQWVTVGCFVIQKMLGGTARQLDLVEGWFNQIHFTF